LIDFNVYFASSMFIIHVHPSRRKTKENIYKKEEHIKPKIEMSSSNKYFKFYCFE